MWRVWWCKVPDGGWRLAVGYFGCTLPDKALINRHSGCCFDE